MTGTWSDPDGDPVTLSTSRGSVADTGAGTWSWELTTTDGPTDSGTVTVTATDPSGATTTTSFDLSVYNVAPIIEEPWSDLPMPLPLGETLDVGATFSDPGTGDTHTALWAWGDGFTSPGSVDPTGPSVSGTHQYQDAGIYTITLTVTDDDGGTSASTYETMVVYDPDQGFVSGAGSIDSAAGAYSPDPSLSGTASFAFVSRYVKGASAPAGATQFRFKIADLNFASSSYDWLIVTGSDYARFKGVGSINGDGEYRFQIWAGDSDPDTFRIRIWTEDDSGVEHVVYDNGIDQEIRGGKILIHKTA